MGRLGSCKPARARRTALADHLDRLILADNPLVESFFHVHQFLHLAFQETGDGDAGPVTDHFGDLFGVDFLFEHEALPAWSSLELRFGFLTSCAFEVVQGAVAQAGGFFKVRMTFGPFDLGFGLVDLPS